MATWTLLLLLFIPCALVFWLVIRQDRGKASSAPRVTDPVCGMRIDSSKAVAIRDTTKGLVYLCSPACVEKFDATPEKFAGHAPSQAGHAHMGC